MALGDQYQATGSTPTCQFSPSITQSPSGRHLKCTRSRRSTGSEQDSSEYTTSGSSIFNAPRVSSGSEENGQTLCSSDQLSDMLDSGLAANMAMFVSLGVPFTVDHTSWLIHSADELIQKCPRSQTPFHVLPEMNSPSENNTAPARMFQFLNQFPKSGSLDELQPRKTASLNDLGNSAREQKWPGNLMSPVRPITPKYPPLQRTPTPPGLPSFGTQEAVAYSAQFFGRSTTNQQNEQRPRGRRAGNRSCDSNRVASYGEALRRLFGFSHSPSSRHRRSPEGVIGRAADGTAVQGCFPYRQSGHGTNVTRRLEDHPFHRRTLPAAVYEPANTDGSPPARYGPSTYAKEYPTAASNHTRSHTAPRTHSAHHSPRPISSRPLPSIPQRAVTAHPRLASPTALFPLPQNFSHNSWALRPHSRLTNSAPSDGTTPNLGITDGPSDTCLTQPQPPLAEAMQARPRLADESPNDEETSGFWTVTRSCFCRPLCDKNIRLSLCHRARTSSAEDNDDVGRNSPVRSPLDCWTVMHPGCRRHVQRMWITENPC